MSITIEELNKLDKDTYQIIDIRDKEEVQKDEMSGAVYVPSDEIETSGKVDLSKKLIICCRIGKISIDVAEQLREKGIDAVSLEGGYTAWLLDSIKRKEAESISRDVEQSIRKKFRKKIWRMFAKAINTYDLVKEGDKIAVCISGGKDSMLMAKLFQELYKHGKKNFEVIFLVMNPGYNEQNWDMIKTNASVLGIDFQYFKTEIFDTVSEIENNPCYLCARMRRGYLYSKAKELGCNKIALGHHFDDVVETTLMSMLYSGKIETMLPKLHSRNFEGMELIRPLYKIREDDIKAWRDYNGLTFIQCACRFTEHCVSCGGGKDSKREEMKELVRTFRQKNDIIDKNIFTSMSNINLDTVLGYKKNGVKHSFLDEY